MKPAIDGLIDRTNEKKQILVNDKFAAEAYKVLFLAKAHCEALDYPPMESERPLSSFPDAEHGESRWCTSRFFRVQSWCRAWRRFHSLTC
jgi:hypothetical protein